MSTDHTPLLTRLACNQIFHVALFLGAASVTTKLRVQAMMSRTWPRAAVSEPENCKYWSNTPAGEMVQIRKRSLLNLVCASQSSRKFVERRSELPPGSFNDNWVCCPRKTCVIN